MIKDGKFGIHEAVWLLSIIIASKAFYSSPAMVVTKVGTAGWYMTLISTGITFIPLILICSLLRRFPGKTLMEIYEIVLGKPIGLLFSLVLFTILLFSAITNLREFIDILKVYILPASPPSYLLILFISIVSVLAFLGLETMARFSKLVAYVLLTGYIVVLAMSVILYEPHRLYPILGCGLENTIINGLKRSSFYGEIVVIGIIINSLHDVKHAKRAAYISLALSGLVTSSALFVFSLAFPYYTGQEISAPIYLLVSLIEYGKFIQRIEPIFFFIWNTSTVISIAGLFYMLILIYSYIFKLDDKRPLIIPFAIILLSLSILPVSMSQVTHIYVEFLRNYGWIFFFIPPVITLAAAKLRNKKGGEADV